ncbi:MAG: bifunctional diaminohydroxyphosphoribosylaminopyrimidine deaminase/5-amino-6-(5-phosphoribosylamino)uracil reductase RibD [Rhodospirillales bacterium]|nr:bifunctional diaminohydroxyphosphoribosylaminopyrimidine deaminase/5-amino-6-(5-phosphoribosylamino)uracil reductase RibD [Rhodospirillales bacterium]
MRAALALARRGLGRVAPNPAVGCVLVKDARIVGRGWTQAGGRPHAETEALARAGEAARGATAYVTLEPCSHHGKTPPCAEALIAAGIARSVVALEDPDPRVSGRGLTLLREAGIAVDSGLLAEAAAGVNAGYLMRTRTGRPLVTLKLATTLDGRIATRGGESRWITGHLARARAHLLRAESDAVLVGSGTAVTDNPRLDVRLPGLEGRSPLRVLLDGRLRLPLTHDLVVRAGEQATCLVTRPGNDPDRLAAYRDAGVELLEVPEDTEGNVSIAAALKALGGRGLNTVMVEGGGRVAAGLLRAGLVDRLVWFRAPRVIGGDGLPAVAGFGLEHLAGAPGFSLVSAERAGEDLVETYRRVP